MGYGQARECILNRILIIPASYPPVLGGVQTVAHRLARQMADRGSEVEVLTRRYPRRLQARELIDGVMVRRRHFFPAARESLKRKRPDLTLASLFFHSGDMRVFRQIMDRFDPDVVNIHFPDWQVRLIPLIRSGRSRRLVISLHGDEVMRALRGDAEQRKRLVAALREADHVTACSMWLLEKAYDVEPSITGKATVIWNGIDGEHYQTAEPMERPRPYILGFGRFVHKKGFDLLIEAFAALKSSESLDLVLVGSGPEQGTLIELAVTHDCGKRVFLPGRALEPEMVQWIRGARLAVIPSREEPFGISALEVAVSGCPMVATAVGGIPEFLGGWDGRAMLRLCEPNPKALAAEMETLLHESESQSIALDRSHFFADRYSWTRCLVKYESILTN